MRTYGETIEVRTADPVEVRDVEPTDPALAPTTQPSAPVQFLWRGRLYLVREVLAHWVEIGTWWSARAPRTSDRPAAATSGRTSSTAPALSDEPLSSDPSRLAVPTARSVAADVGAVEREVWRVEAASGRAARVGVYDLVRDIPAARPASSSPPSSSLPRPPERWRLARTLD